MPVSPQSLRNAANFMMRQTGEKPTWLYDAADDIERLTKQLDNVRTVVMNDVLTAEETIDDLKSLLQGDHIAEQLREGAEMFLDAMAAPVSKTDEKGK